MTQQIIARATPNRDETGRFVRVDPIPDLRRYWSDPAERACVDAQKAAWHAEINAMLDASIARRRVYSDDVL